MIGRDLRTSRTFAEIEALCTLIRRPGLNVISDALEPDVSANGQFVAFTGVVVEDALTGALPTRICLADRASGDVRTLTEGSGVERLPRIAPDGLSIAYLSDPERRGDWQLRILDIATGKRVGGADVDGWVEYLQWSPNGRRVLLGVAGRGAHLASGQGATELNLEAAEFPAWMPVIESSDESAAWRRLWVFDSVDGSVEAIGPSDANVWEAAWCGDEQVVAVTSPGPREGLWYSAHLELLGVESGRKVLLRPEAQLGWPSGTPSGGRIAIVEAFSSDRQIVAGDLVVVDTATAVATRVDTAGIDVTFTSWRSDDCLLIAGHRGLESVVAVYNSASDVLEETWASSELTSAGRYLSVAGIGVNGDCVLIGENFTTAPELAVIEAGQYRAIRSFDVGYNDAASAIQSVEQCSWIAADGLELQGLLLRPFGASPHPLVVYVHGGPILHSRPSFLGRMPLALALVRAGYAVFYPNPRGSSGRGQAFARMVQGDLGGADTGDLLAGVDALVERGHADPTRIGVTGISYGGFQSCWLVTRDTRFAAAVPVSPHTNQTTAQLLSNISEFMPLFLQDAYDDPAGKYTQRSPVMFARHVVTPTLCVAGARDECTPPEEAAQFHRALREHGVESELVIYPEEGHGVRNYPAVIDFIARSVMWFRKHMPPREDTP